MSDLVERMRETQAQLRKFVYESALGNGHEPSRLLRLARDQLSEAADALERAERDKDQIVENAVSVLTGGCADHGKLSFEAFTQAGGGACPICLTSALERAERERDEAQEALKPFAECVEQISGDKSDEEWAKFRLLVGDYRRAALAYNAALSQAANPLPKAQGEDE